MSEATKGMSGATKGMSEATTAMSKATTAMSEGSEAMSGMRVALYGLGYVGSVTAVCLADGGHRVFGIDLDQGKADSMRRGEPPVVEPGLEPLLERALAAGRFTPLGPADAIPDVDVHLVCVGTPSQANGSLDLTHVEAVAAEIGARLVASAHRQTVVIRSTVLPGTVETSIVPILEAVSNQLAGRDFGVAMCPEFLRETTAVADFFEPPFTVVGVGDDAGSHDAATESTMRSLFAFLDRPLHVVDIPTAETIKYACNAFHAVKVAFANEVGRFAKETGADAMQAMEIFCTDDQLNISPAYLRPGFAFGGSCLPKDLRAFTHRGRQLDLDLPLLSSVLPSNDQHLRAATEAVMATAPQSVALLGLTFKTGTDDVRESPFVRLAETLIGKGIDVRIWDPDLRPERLVGRNLSFVDARLPHLVRLLHATADEAADGADVVALGSSHPDATAAVAGWSGRVVDLSGAARSLRAQRRQELDYEGAAW